MKKIIMPIFVLLALVGCKPAEKTITVPEFIHNPDLVTKTQGFCTANPAERESLPNCKNVAEAANIAFNMKEFNHCFKHGQIISHECIDQYLAEKGIK